MADRKVAIITAGGSGMGADAAKRLAADGYNVAILSSSGKGESLAQDLGGIGVTGGGPAGGSGGGTSVGIGVGSAVMNVPLSARFRRRRSRRTSTK